MGPPPERLCPPSQQNHLTLITECRNLCDANWSSLQSGHPPLARTWPLSEYKVEPITPWPSHARSREATSRRNRHRRQHKSTGPPSIRVWPRDWEIHDILRELLVATPMKIVDRGSRNQSSSIHATAEPLLTVSTAPPTIIRGVRTRAPEGPMDFLTGVLRRAAASARTCGEEGRWPSDPSERSRLALG
jgi:hypothetical protein